MAVTYIKLSNYIIPYLRKKYGGEPIRIPETNNLYYYISNFVLPNPDLKRMANSAMCERLWTIDKMAADGGGDYNSSVGTDSESYIAIELPLLITCGGQARIPNDTWQFTDGGLKAFRQRIRSEFWADLEIYVKDFHHNCIINSMDYNTEMGVRKFMDTYDIDTDYLENIMRNRRRVVNRYKIFIAPKKIDTK